MSKEGEDPTSDPAMEIEAMLQASTGSWNAGDLDGFLDDYWQSEELTFSGADGVTRGWMGLRDRYAAGYWAPGVTRDSLRFEDLEVVPLGQGYALALGRYVLYRPGDTETTTGSGYFSLVLARVEGVWKILHDHTSASPVGEEPVANVSDAPGGG
jgi:beta-aspartyl-peptidase (threonine type)